LQAKLPQYIRRMNGFSYLGGELDLFSKAKNWKAYWSRQIIPFLQGSVLEAGAGIGSNTKLLFNDNVKNWICLEPDGQLLDRLKANLTQDPDLNKIQVVNGTLSDLEQSAQFDSIVYIDVVEHIEADAKELATAAARLNKHGFLIVLSPAHPWLYSEFDARIGHFRRYTKQSLISLAPAEMQLCRLRYLDCCGLGASLANRLFLHQGLPTVGQIEFWDRNLIPPSTVLDALTGYLVGKSILGIWQKP
jgi:2-polyprenyl-3-methyl-5-hydroxy-6-metoxy-1,4-benzoquinol methylase